MTTIHWVHATEASRGGLLRLARRHRVIAWWDEDPGSLPQIEARPMDHAALAAELGRGDVVLAPRPTDLEVARIATGRGAHLVCGWHVSSSLRAAAEAAEIAVVTEVGMVPGIDHLMARDLVQDYRSAAHPDDVLHFTSHGGGMPRYPDNFRHKFNASPLPLLFSLTTPTRWIEQGQLRETRFPFDAIVAHDLNLPVPERHQVYPHYDIVPYLEAYGFDRNWTVATARRGAIRLKGWDEGWAGVFERLRRTGKDEQALTALAEELRRDHPYQPGEADRVVISVGLRAERDGRTVWHKEWVLDDSGSRTVSARARIGGLMLSLGGAAAAAGRFAPGLTIGPTDPGLVAEWLVAIAESAQHMRRLNHVASPPPAALQPDATPA